MLWVGPINAGSLQEKCCVVVKNIAQIQECIPVGCVPPAHWPHLVVRGVVCMLEGGMHARGGVCMPGEAHSCPEAVCMPRGWGVHTRWRACWGVGAVWDTHPPMDRILDTRLWKHYLPTTAVAGGNKLPSKFSCLRLHLWEFKTHLLVLIFPI